MVLLLFLHCEKFKCGMQSKKVYGVEKRHLLGFRALSHMSFMPSITECLNWSDSPKADCMVFKSEVVSVYFCWDMIR